MPLDLSGSRQLFLSFIFSICINWLFILILTFRVSRKGDREKSVLFCSWLGCNVIVEIWGVEKSWADTLGGYFSLGSSDTMPRPQMGTSLLLVTYNHSQPLNFLSYLLGMGHFCTCMWLSFKALLFSQGHMLTLEIIAFSFPNGGIAIPSWVSSACLSQGVPSVSVSCLFVLWARG